MVNLCNRVPTVLTAINGKSTESSDTLRHCESPLSWQRGRRFPTGTPGRRRRRSLTEDVFNECLQTGSSLPCLEMKVWTLARGYIALRSSCRFGSRSIGFSVSGCAYSIGGLLAWVLGIEDTALDVVIDLDGACEFTSYVASYI